MAAPAGSEALRMDAVSPQYALPIRGNAEVVTPASAVQPTDAEASPTAAHTTAESVPDRTTMHELPSAAQADANTAPKAGTELTVRRGTDVTVQSVARAAVLQASAAATGAALPDVRASHAEEVVSQERIVDPDSLHTGSVSVNHPLLPKEHTPEPDAADEQRPVGNADMPQQQLEKAANEWRTAETDPGDSSDLPKASDGGDSPPTDTPRTTFEEPSEGGDKPDNAQQAEEVRALIAQAAELGVDLSPESALKVSKTLILVPVERATRARPEHVAGLVAEAAFLGIRLTEAAALEVSRTIVPEPPKPPHTVIASETTSDTPLPPAQISDNIPPIATTRTPEQVNDAVAVLQPVTPNEPVLVTSGRRYLQETGAVIGEMLRWHEINYHDLLPKRSTILHKYGDMFLDRHMTNGHIAQVAAENGDTFDVASARHRFVTRLREHVDLPPNIAAVISGIRVVEGIPPVGIRLNEFRKLLGISVAQMAGRVGTSTDNMTRLLTSEAHPTPERMIRVMQALGVPRETMRELLAEYETEHGLAISAGTNRRREIQERRQNRD
ncbi:MAG TPA: helix-turn-helix transcriptional regulator [Candidatus Saccharimonadales bacterium]|nr:helix-turn-helix transcriptional regulator [Candidatus Saccharimonadales bacterium]